ncbi:glyoxalase [Pseudomonas amygdali pv. eriobotryae]|uniref:Glyoxalase n=1 Tax=Pseudomonas amygdali pv. eriobotryae TaxID=129137 RepID=A0A9P3AJD9_PSEA0|nr:VOC family protein [Pseudomonas amygdali]KWS78364.1 lactoylglutathione lyase [Pseudomonas amygdali pv. eriobotryae]GFZ62801.1 glyoxalase [Pseudomonas amygdali pv. eriobotryae]GFZ68147.1 glyoxalase [Pseudomonas amygdali pv. eriobotryae]GFZ73863.1 glyoxalase [Pseudomonas amygdali pv. eriobotryae]
MASDGIFSALHHVCIVIHDLDKAVAYYESIGVGPWHDFPSLDAFKGELLAPDAEDFVRLQYKYANLENIQLQLCAPPKGNTLQRRFLEERGEGVFHLGFTVPDCDAAQSEALALGLNPILSGRLPNRNGFTYFDSDRQGAAVTLQVRAMKQ